MTDQLSLVHRILSASALLAALLTLTGSIVPGPIKSSRSKLEAQAAKARTEFNRGHLREGLKGFNIALALAKSIGDVDWTIKLQSNTGSGYYAIYKYRDAMRAYLDARTFAHAKGRQSLVAMVEVNLTSLYIVMGDLDAANQTAEHALRIAGSSELQGQRHKLLACLAELRAQQGRKNEAVSYFLEALRSADVASDTPAVVSIWEHLGELMLRDGNFKAAEGPLLEAFRLSLLTHDRDIRVCYYNLAWLRVEQGDLASGAALLAHADTLPIADGGAPPWFVSYIKGRLALKHGNTRTAARFYHDAFHQSVGWQQEVGPADQLHSVSFARREFQRVYDALAETNLASGPQLAIDTFEATEEYRAAALRQTLANNSRWLKNMPPEYWSLLDQLRATQIDELTNHSKKNVFSILGLRRDLNEMQSEYSTVGTKTVERNQLGLTLRSIQSSLGPDEALFSFYVGAGNTALWAVTKQRIERYPLPSAAVILAMAEQFRSDIQNRRGSNVARPLYRALFQNLDTAFLTRKTWIISAVDAMFSIPYVALETGRDGDKPVYLLEQHVVLQTPSALMLTPSGKPVRPTGRFVGLGDGIYNSADTRWHAPARPFGFLHRTPGLALQLPRLAASGPEIEACASKWDGPEQPLLLKGHNASSRLLQTALQAHPAVLHLAVHVIAPTSDRPEESAIDLGTNPDGRPDVLTSDDISVLDASNTTVVMSGCSSASGPAVAGKGVLGLTRAWLLAGARAVVGSRWPTPDDTGELFQSFYKHFRDRRDDSDRARAVARSLSEAQLEMLHSGTWRSSPWYWSAFYALGKE